MVKVKKRITEQIGITPNTNVSVYSSAIGGGGM
jgi:hypothetical protein